MDKIDSVEFDVFANRLYKQLMRSHHVMYAKMNELLPVASTIPEDLRETIFEISRYTAYEVALACLEEMCADQSALRDQ